MTLRYAYNTNGAASHRLDDALGLIADSGYAGVALTLDHHHLDPFADDWVATSERVGARLRMLGLGCVIETGARYLLDPRDKHEPTFVSGSHEGRAVRASFIERAVDIARIVSAETVSFWAGVPKVGVDRDAAHRWLGEGIDRVLGYASAKGVELSFEPEPGMLIETVADYARLALRFPALRLALDTGHCLVTQDIEPAQAVRDYADRLGTVSIEDMRRGDHTHLPFGTGDMDIASVLRALREIGFTRLICVELSRESPRAHVAIPESIAYLRALD